MVAFAAAACYEPPAPDTYQIAFMARTDDGHPVEGVELRSETEVIGLTGPAGTLGLEVEGYDGASMAFRAVCPAGYRSPTQDVHLTLRPFTGVAEQAEPPPLVVSATCRPFLRRATVVIRANGWANLPIVLHERIVARTDQDGVAHLLLTMAPHARFQLTVDTTAHPRLQPRNPTQLFQIGDEDELFVYDLALSADPLPPKKKKKKRKRKPPPDPVQMFQPLKGGR